MHFASKNSHLAIEIPDLTIAVAAVTPSERFSNRTMAAAIFSGIPKIRRVSSVITASVPSEPTNNLVRSYPAESFLVSLPVRITVPSAITAVSAKTLSRIEPYRTVVVPAAPVAAMPPNVASAPGSTEKNNPERANFSFNSTLCTPGWTRTSRSSDRISIILFI